MSSAEVAAKVVKNLEPEDYKLLKVLASGLKQHESLTRKEITTYSKIHENIVDFRINRLHDMKLIGKNKGGFTLLMMGLDTVALKMLVDKEIIDKVDHKHLNLDVDFMKGVIPSTENIAVSFWNQIESKINSPKRKLYSIRIRETQNNSVEYRGEK